MPVTNIKSTWASAGNEGGLTFYDGVGGGNVLILARDGVYANSTRYASTWYVDGNTTNTTQDGKTWATAFDTLAEGLAAAHSFQSTAANRAWAKRSVVYVVGDALVEDLTAMAEKTDVIGVGQCDGQEPGARVQGNHVITSTAYIGCRWFNIAFFDADASGIIFTLPTQQGATVFDNCTFLTGASTVTGLLATAVTDLQVRNCKFFGSWNAGFSTAAISLGAGSGNRTIIENCQISNTHATGVCILVDISRSAADSYIRDNYLNAVGMPIDDNSDSFYIVNNRWVTGIDCATYTNGFDLNLLKASGNLQTGSNAGDHDSVPHILFA